jgi:hypothetical protein
MLILNGFSIFRPHNRPDFHWISSEWIELRPSETEMGNQLSLIQVMMAVSGPHGPAFFM